MANPVPSATVQTFILGQNTSLAEANTSFNTALAAAQATAQTTGSIISAGVTHSITADSEDTYIVWAMLQYATPYVPGS